MLFVFPPLIQAGIAAGQYEVVKNAAGIALGIARDKATGQFIGHAIGMLGNGGIPFNPVVVPLQFTQMYQMQQGFKAVQVGLQSIQASLGVLQTVTALTGIGVAANLAVSALSFWQILKLREDVKLQRLEMQEGFLDLKKVLKGQGKEILEKIDEAVQDIEFRNHRQALAQAYGKFIEAARLMKIAISCEDLAIRNSDLANARQTLGEALADYKNPHLLPEVDSVTKLRRSECIWAIEQTIALTYQLQNQPEALSYCLQQLQNRVCNDVLEVVRKCESEDELEIIFPEITRICEQDLVLLKVWQEQVAWERSLSSSQKESLQEIDVNHPETFKPLIVEHSEIPPEQLLYETLREKSHFPALCDVLQLMISTEIRQEYETYIDQQAKYTEHKALTVTNLQQMSNLSVANLFWYFQVRDESEQTLLEEDFQEA